MLGEYRETWRATGPAGRRFLTGGVFYAARMMLFLVSFPLFAKTRGFDSGEIGWLVGAVSLSLFVFGIPVTALGTRGHTRPLLMAGPLMSAVGLGTILVAPSGSFWLTFAGCLFAGMSGTMFWILGDPLLASTTPASQRGHVYALKFALFTGGMSLGGGLGGWVPAGLSSVAGFSDARALAGTLVAGVIVDIVQVVVYSAISRDVMPRARVAASRVSRGLREHPPRKVWLLLVLLAMPEAGMATGHNSIRPFLTLFFEEEHGLSAGLIGTIMACFALGGGVGSLFLPSIAKRIGNLNTVRIFRAVAAGAVALCFGGMSVVVVLGLLFTYYAIADGTEATFITEGMERVPVAHRPVFSGFYAMIWSVASFIAAAASGALQNSSGFAAAFGLGIAGYGFSIFWITVIYPRLPSLVSRDEHAKSGEPMREEFAAVPE
jgi:predicted MFS family arabinose efflux permease